MTENEKQDDLKLSRITFEVDSKLKRKVVIYCAEKNIKSIKNFIISLIKEKVD